MEAVGEELNAGEYLTKSKPVAVGVKRSAVWEVFDLIVDKATQLEEGFVQCTQCKSILTYTCKTGPSSSKKHIDSFCPGTIQVDSDFRPIPPLLQSRFVNKLADTCALTMGSVHMLTSEPIKALLQLAIDITAACKGRVNVDDLVPHETTVMNRVGERATECRRKLVPRVQERQSVIGAARRLRTCGLTTRIRDI